MPDSSPPAWPPATADGAFTTTQWTVIMEAAREGDQGTSRALQRLCESYWTPVYAYFRRHGRSREDSQDMTQAFFAALLEKRTFGAANPAKGKFRTFLLNGVKFFAMNEWQKSRAEKRGGGIFFISANADEAEAHVQAATADNYSPDVAFEREWARTLLADTERTLRDEFARRGKDAFFDRLQPFLAGGHGGSTYAEIASEAGTSEASVKMAVQRMRKRFAELLRARIAETVESPEEVEEEIRALLLSFS